MNDRDTIPEDVMPLTRALDILARVHTRDDELVGYVVMMGATPDYNGDEYIKAWASVRHALGASYRPS